MRFRGRYLYLESWLQTILRRRYNSTSKPLFCIYSGSKWVGGSDATQTTESIAVSVKRQWCSKARNIVCLVSRSQPLPPYW